MTAKSPLDRLTPDQIEEIGREFGRLHVEVFDNLGDRDARYIRSMVSMHRKLALGGRVLLPRLFPPAWLAGTIVLSLAKILENMAMVQRSILRLAFPGGRPRSKPDAYRGPTLRTSGERELADLADAAVTR